jgi:cytochrome c
MYDQPKYKPLQGGSHLTGSSSAMSVPAGTVSRDERRTIDTFDTGMKDGKLSAEVPFPVNRSVLERGRDRYGIYCAPCHGQTGDGRGMIVMRGFSPPPSLSSQELREAPVGHFFDVITHGHGAMYSYAARVEPRDRWAIAAYIRVLQLSQYADESTLPAADRERLKEARR